MTAPRPDDRPGDTSVAVDQDTGGRPWWLLLLLALLALLLVGLLLWWLLSDDDSDGIDAAVPAVSESATPVAPSAEPVETPEPEATADPSVSVEPLPSDDASSPSPAPAPPSGDPLELGELRVADVALLPLPTSRLPELVGMPVRGAGVPVQSVPADSGFWVGPSEAERVWVQLTGPGESPYEVTAGKTVSFSDQATLVANAPGFVDSISSFASADGEDLLRTQGYHVEVPKTALSPEPEQG